MTQPLPWRLSKDERYELNRRVVNMWCPHYRDKLYKDSFSFWKKPKYVWKSVHKLRVFLVFLPTILRDFVPAVHRAILKITFALRRLDGLVVSIDEARRLGVLPGSHVLPTFLWKPNFLNFPSFVEYHEDPEFLGTPRFVKRPVFSRLHVFHLIDSFS